MFKTLCSLALFATAAFAQSIDIGIPAKGAFLVPGTNINVQIQQPVSQTSYENVAIVIGFQSCSTGPCVSPDTSLPNILYSGPFNPQPYDPTLPPYENFTVMLPDAPRGAGLIGVEFFALVGAENYLFTEILNHTVGIA